MKYCAAFVLFLMTWTTGISNKRVGRRIIRSQKCKYTFVVKEIVNDNCPASVYQRSIQSDTTNAIPSGDAGSLLSRLTNVERQLNDEMEKNVNLNMTLSKQEREYKTNVTNILHLINRLQQSIHMQRQGYRDLEKKLSTVTLDVVEMSTVLNHRNNPNTENSHLTRKAVDVEAVSKIHNCPNTNSDIEYRDCEDVYKRGHRTSGVYYITPMYAACAIPVWCDMETPPGGWLIIQRRKNGLLDFNRYWNEYRNGFGNVVSEFWMGLDNMFLISNQDYYELRVDLWDFDDNRVNAIYKSFKIDGARDKYRFHASQYEGSAADSLSAHSGMRFSTPDDDNDNIRDYHCAREWQSGWWYINCWSALLNGPYQNKSDVRYRTLAWNEWKHEQLARTEMKIRPSRLHYNNTHLNRT